MYLPSIENKDEVTDERVTYLAGLAQTLSTQNDFTIQNFSDSSVSSTDVQFVLETQSTIDLLNDIPTQDVAFDVFNPLGNSVEMFALSFPQENAIFPGIWDNIRNLFGRLRRKVKRIFCKVVAALQADQGLDLRKIIKQVLLALIPALAASTGLMPIALPIVISLTAMLIKYGVSRVCPI